MRWPPANISGSRLLDSNLRIILLVSVLALIGSATPCSRGDASGFLIITAERLAPSFQPLLDARQREGYRAFIVTTESIATSSPGRDFPERVRNRIRDAWKNDAVRHVLLGGDTSIIPARYAFVPRQSSEAESLVPADLYFSCLDGSWNRDGDARWGEATDGEGGDDVDLVAEVNIGRAPVETPVEVEVFVRKTIAWSSASSDSRGLLFISTALEQGAAQGGAMLDHSASLFAERQLEWLDDRPGTSPRWNAADALAALNRNPRIVVYAGHAAPDSLMRLTAEHLSSLTNTVPFLLVSVGCHAGEFDNPSISPDALGERLVTCPHGGAAAALLNARAGWYDARNEVRYSGEFQAAFLAQLKQSPVAMTLGEIQARARESLRHQLKHSGGVTYRWCYYGLNLLGDPCLQMSSAIPGGPETNVTQVRQISGVTP